MNRRSPLLLVLACASASLWAATTPQEEWKLDREDVFEFARKPALVQDGDRIEISFETAGWCDVTVAIEDPQGHIVRHLACGVLGPNAPEPLQKDSKAQRLVWDGKDERGEYIDDKERYRVRVSLGLNATFEKNLLWEPKKRIGAGRGVGFSSHHGMPAPIMAAAPEGVYVFEGHGVDHLRLFGHDGRYLRTIYPFPAGKIEAVKGIERRAFPQDGQDLPVKQGFLQATLLTAGATGQKNGYTLCEWGSGASAIAVQSKRLALTHFKLNRLATDGSTGGLDLTGPEVQFPINLGTKNRGKEGSQGHVQPKSIAFSPDGKYLYMTAYQYRGGVPGRNLVKECLQGVARIDFAKGDKVEVFAGNFDEQIKRGKGEKDFGDPTSVDVDAKGRVYVSDFLNDRVQVFDSSGKLLKSIKAQSPAKVSVSPLSGEIWVFSWMLMTTEGSGRAKVKVAKPTLTRLKSFEDPRKLESLELPFGKYAASYENSHFWGGLEHIVCVDWWAKPAPRLWLSSGSNVFWQAGGSGELSDISRGFDQNEEWDQHNISLWDTKGSAFARVAHFGEDVKKAVPRAEPPFFWRQRLYVNPATGKLYVGEGNKTRWYKAFHQFIEVDPETGKGAIMELPLSAEDAGFDLDGLLYLRNFNAVTRWQLSDMREVPFDYGEEMKGVGLAPDSGGRKADAIGALRLMAPPYVSLWHNGGFWISPKGHLILPGLIAKDESLEVRGDGKSAVADRVSTAALSDQKLYEPQYYAGRKRVSEVHVYDRKGKLLIEDAIPGIRKMFGIAMDREDNLYVLSHAARVLGDGKPFNPRTSTLIKVKPKATKTYVNSKGGSNPPIPLAPEAEPKRLPELFNGHKEWMDGYEWMYGGLIFSGKGDPISGGGCSCWNGRFTLDLFGRSYAPETDRYSIAVLDSAGNLILRIGRYGNADSAGVGSQAPLGGDEVGLFHAQYLGVHTDRRLFVADAGNARIFSVKLDYAASATVPLKADERYGTARR